MAGAPTPIADVSGTSASLVTTLEQLAAIIGALQGSVQTMTSQSGATQAMQTQIADTLKNLQTSIDATNANLKSLSEVVNKMAVSGETDSGFTLRSTSTTDPGDDQHRMMNDRDKTANVGLQMISDLAKHASDIDVRRLALFDSYLKYTDAVWSRSADHFSVLPPVTPRVPSGPGSMDATKNA